MSCPSCHVGLAEGARFCHQCGSPVVAGAASQPEAPRGLEAAFGTQYKLERLLGRGGMGAVYLARETALERQVAIKVLPPERAETSDSRERFRREARTAAKLTHPNIVPLHTFGDANGVMYLVMGYVRGEALAARLRREGRLPVEETLRILGETADALDYAHRQGIVHRDIKPDNVLIDDDSGRAMLTDFGVAKAAGVGHTLTAIGTILGTPHYMSPEQASGKQDVDGRSDIYSLGVMAYAMLSGRLPFEGKTPGDVLVQHITKDPPPLGLQAPHVPDVVSAAVMRCLAKDPAARWPDAGSLREALRGAGGDDDLPEVLKGVDTFAQLLIAALLLLGYFALYRAAWEELGELGLALYRLLSMLVVLFTVWIAGIAWKGHRQGFLWSTILRSALRQPSWWRGWYPRALRRPADVWDRLPPPLRRTRIAATAFFACLLAAVHLLIAAAAGILYSHRTGRDWWRAMDAVADLWFATILIGLVLFITTVLLLNSALKWLRTQTGLREDAAAVLREHTAKRSFWEKPQVAMLLLPAPGAPLGKGSPRDPPDYLRAIIRAAGGLEGVAREAADEAAAVARRLASSLEALDREIADLGRDADPAEAARLEEKLAALGAEVGAEGESRRQMRDLLHKQLDLVRGVASQLEEAKGRRERQIERLRGLWREVEGLSRRGSDSPEAREIAARLRILCGDIQRETSEEPGGTTATGGISELPTRER